MVEIQNRQDYNSNFFKKWAPIYDYLAIVIAKLRSEAAKKVNISNKKILDVACGTGALSIAFAKRGFSVVGIDLSEDMLIQARRKIKPKYDIRFLLRDATKIDFPDNTFDVSSISLGLHDMPQDVAISVLKEMTGVTKKGGQILIIDYNTPQNPFGYQFMKLWESQYYVDFIKKGINYFLNQAGLSAINKQTYLLGNYQIVECINKKD